MLNEHQILVTRHAWRLLALLCVMGASPSFAQTPQMFSRTWHNEAAKFQSEHYDVLTDLDKASAETFAQHMDMVFEAYAEFFEFLRVRKKLRFELYLFADETEYLEVLEGEFDADARGTGGMNITEGSRNALAVWVGPRSEAEVKQVLQHEGFHQFAAALFSNMPRWMNEGLAELFELALFVDGAIILGEVPEAQLRRLQGRLKQNSLMSVRSLIDIDGDDWLDHVNAGEGSLQYLQSWSMVHFLIYGEGARHQPAFQSILRQLNDGRSWESAYMKAFGTNQYDEFESAWHRYLMTVQATDMKETIRRLDFLAAGLKKLHAEDVEPKTMQELREALQEREFKHRCELFGTIEILESRREKLFSVPKAVHPSTRDLKITFELHEAIELRERRGKYVPQRRAGKDIPQIVTTQGLEPRQFGFGWLREKSGELRRIIVAK